MAKRDEPWERQALRFFLFLLVIGLVVVVPKYALRYTARVGTQTARFLLGQLGRPFGRRWFQSTRHLIWQTNFIAMPPDDEELTRWLAAQSNVAASQVRREPYWIVFDCVLRGYFLGFSGIQEASTAKARTLGYDTGQGIAIITIKE